MKQYFLSLAAALTVAAVGCGDGSSGAGGDGGTGATAGDDGTGATGGEPWVLSVPIDEARQVDDREYQLYVPSGLDLNEPTPLVLSFHGSTPGDMPASVLQRGVSGGNPHAQDNGYIIVYPQGLVRGQNQGWDTGPISADIDFVDTIIAELDDEFGIDERRIYAGGISNGGAFSYTLACTRGEVFAAIAPVAGALPTDCPLVELIPAIVFHGTDDELVSYDRGSTSAEAWALRNRCAERTETVFENGDSTCEAWIDCQTPADVELCTVDGGGHTWPGSPFADIFESFGVGFTTQDLDATDRMWAFFRAHPK